MAQKNVKLKFGSIYQLRPNSNYYFRYQVDGQRRTCALKTANLKEAIAEAQKLFPIIEAPTAEIASEHVRMLKGASRKIQGLALGEAWEVYAKHHDRATPATVSEQECYRVSFQEFVDFIGDPSVKIQEITQEQAGAFAEWMRKQHQAVDTHNRKLRRIRKIFDVLQEYRDSAENPFKAKSLFRKEREEQGTVARRLAFTREQEEQILKALENPLHKVMNKAEIRVIYHIGMFTGQRFKDCVLLQWNSVDLNRKMIRVKQYKTGQEVVIPIAPKLLEVLLEAQKWQTNPYVCPATADRYNQVDELGKNVGNNLVNKDALRVIKWIGLEPSIKVAGRKRSMTVYGFHSLRHSFASHCAETGIPMAVAISILGASSEILSQYYTHIGEINYRSFCKFGKGSSSGLVAFQ